MTRPAEDVAATLALNRDGLGASAIARRLDLPRSTVREWLAGRVPRSASARLGGACVACGHAAHKPEELPASYVYLLGVYLGDGCISQHQRGVFRLRIYLDARYPEIVDEVAGAVEAVLPGNAVGRRGHQGGLKEHEDPMASCIEVSSYSRSWPCLFPQHGPGMKHLRRIVLEGWQRRLVERDPRPLLRGLIHSDGCRFTNTGRGGWSNPRYGFYNSSQDIRGIFFDACDLLDLHATWARPATVYVSGKADVARMDEFIGPKA